MKIREKLTLQFSAIVGLIFIVFSISIYYVSHLYRYNAFKNRLREKALNTANLLIEVDEIDTNLLKELRRSYLQALPEEFVRVYNQNDEKIFKDDTLNYNFPHEKLEAARKDGEVDYKTGDRQFVALRFKNNYVILASARNINGEQELRNLAFVLIIATLISLLVIILSGWLFSRQALKPVSKMIREVDSIGETNLSSRLDEGKKRDELAHLAITFNKMFDRIEDAFERQRRFVANASHELRTPLTTITGEIEVALMKGRSEEQYVQVLLSVLEEAKTLTKLSNDLLKLTQTGKLNKLIVQKIGIMDLLDTLGEESYKRNNKAVLRFEFDETASLEDLWISGNMELLKTAFMNIIDNAFKYSYYKPVTLHTSVSDQSIYIRIQDQGIGMTEEEIEFIFQPFFRSENVSAINGNGIGLSLTEKIIKLHGGKIVVASIPRIGTEITVMLPLEDR